jgi:hypothetical protein
MRRTLADDQMIDVNGVKNVTVESRQDGRVIWISVDGVTRLRCNALQRAVQEGFVLGAAINLSVTHNKEVKE